MKPNHPTKKLKEICDIQIGGTPRRGVVEYWENGELPWVSIADMSRGGKIIIETKEKITEKGAKESNVKFIPEGSLLFSFKLSIGKLAFAGCDLYTNEAIAGLIIKNEKELDKDFLFYYLSQMSFDDTTTAVKGKTLNKTKIENLEIPLPPLSIQKKIVARLDELLGGIAEAKVLRQEALADTEKILSATLREIFTEGKERGWKEKSFDDKNILKITSGGTPSRSNSSYYSGDIPWLKSGELADNVNIIKSEEHISEEAIKNSSAKIFPKGTVLFAMYGATAGKIGILGMESATNQAVAGLVVNSEKLINKFLYYFLINKRDEMIAKAWGGAQPNLSQTILKTFTILLPPLPEQQKIVEQLDVLSERLAQLHALQQEQLADLHKLEKAYLREAFNGQFKL